MSINEFMNSIDEYATELYAEDEIFVIGEHIRNYFGEFSNIFHEVMSPDIHVDVCVIPPEPGRDFYTLVTMGMGAHIMNVPDDLKSNQLERAELVITLPPDWKIVSEEERWHWPLKLLKILARLPIECDTWLGWGHTIDNGVPFAPNTELCGTLLVSPQGGINELNEDADICILPNGDEVHFYHLIPLHRREMEFKKMYGAEALIEYALAEVPHVVDIKRPDGCAEWNEQEDLSEMLSDIERLDEMSEYSENVYYQNVIIDDGQWHLEKLREKKLPVDELNAYSHIAIFMRWCMENDMMSGVFFFKYVNIIEAIEKEGFDTFFDFRQFLRDEKDIKGCILKLFFAEHVQPFIEYYYNDDDMGFPADIDDYAKKYVIGKFGKERFESGEFKNEEYLFVPFDEDYYEGMKKYMDSAYRKWLVSYADVSMGMIN